MTEAPTLDVPGPAAGPAVAHRCRAPRRDGAGTCGRPLYDDESIRRGDIGPECWDRLHGPAPGAARAGSSWSSPGPGQDALPLDTTPTAADPCPGCWARIPIVRGVLAPHPCPASGLTPAAARALAGHARAGQ